MIAIIVILSGLFGLIIGSFLNVVIWRGPLMWGLMQAPAHSGKINLAAPRSHCPNCGTHIKALHLLPIIGFILLRGRCAACDASISKRYFVVELLGALSAIIAVLIWGFTIDALAGFTFFCFCIALGVIDFETTYLPDALTLPLIILGLLVNISGVFVPLTDALIGAIVGYGAFRLIGAAYHSLRGTEGLGQGDAKLLTAIGAWGGWAALPFVVLLSAMAGLVAILVLKMAGKEMRADMAVPFGPFLCGAACILMLMQDMIYYY